MEGIRAFKGTLGRRPARRRRRHVWVIPAADLLKEARAGLRARARHMARTIGGWVRAGFIAGTGRVAMGHGPGMPAPSVPTDGGAWLAHAGADGAWRVRALGGDGHAWRRLDGREFGNFRVQVAEAGGVMITVQTREEGGVLVETRHRTVGHSLDGDRRDCPAVLRRSMQGMDYFYFSAGNPIGHERVTIACMDGPEPALRSAA